MRCNVNHATRWAAWNTLLSLAVFVAGCSASSINESEPTPAQSEPALVAVATTGADDGAETDRIQAYIDSQYQRSDVHHTFRTRLAQEIDCVDFYAQPAFKIPELKGRGLPEHVPSPPTGMRVGAAPVTSDLNDGSIDDDGNVRLCPGDTVPIVRLTVESIK